MTDSIQSGMLFVSPFWFCSKSEWIRDTMDCLLCKRGYYSSLVNYSYRTKMGE